MSKKLNLVNEIFKPNDKGISEWITRDELNSTQLALTSNGNSRYGVMFGVNYYIWDIKRKTDKKFSQIIALRTNGINSNNDNISRPISNTIRNYFKDMPCVNCGLESTNKSTQFVIDHKNDLYNDSRVLNTKTQLFSDFQKLCNRCNLIKREICKKTRETGKRIAATSIGNIAEFGIDFVEGDETFNPNDINAMVGTYWYDPVEFRKKAIEIREKKAIADYIKKKEDRELEDCFKSLNL